MYDPQTGELIHFDPRSGRYYPSPSVPQQHYHPPAHYDPFSQLSVQQYQQIERSYERRSDRKGRVAGIAVGGFLLSWLAAGIHPAITLGIWFLLIGWLTHRAVKGS